MFQYLGYRVLALHRTRIGSLQLGRLRTGAVRPLTADEVSSLRGTARLWSRMRITMIESVELAASR